ncbi:MAG TPA: hypothetical protein VHX63_15325 [Acidobacteriaceae bacterium]|nr:hypothetical protein [Acidobacteriaceae bacterium]
MTSSTSSNPKERFQQQLQRQPQPTKQPESFKQLAAQIGEEMAAYIRKQPDNPQVDY